MSNEPIHPSHPSQTRRRRIFLPVFCGLCLLLGGCDQPDESTHASADEALKERLEAAAEKRGKRASISFGFIHALDDISPGGPVRLQPEIGREVEVEQAFLVVSAIEAHLCEPGQTPTQITPEDTSRDTPDRPGVHDQTAPGFVSRVGDWLVSPAHAHVPSSATRLGTPFVEDLLAPGQARIIDEIAPPMAAYCNLFAIVSPADDDIVNLTDLDTAEMVGKTLLLRGRYRYTATRDTKVDESEWERFESVSVARDIIQVDAVDPQSGQSPLTLDTANASRMLLLDKRISPDLFDGLSVEDFDSSKAADQVLARLEARFKIYRFKNK